MKMPKGVRPHKSGGFLASICIDRKRYSRVCKTVEEAVAARTEMANAHDISLPVMRQKTNDWTLTYAIEKTFQLVWDGKGSEETNKWNSADIMKFFGEHTRIKTITLDKIDDYVAHLLNNGNSGSTINRKLSCLSRILRTAFDRGKITSLPKMPRRREGTHRIRFLSPQEEERLLKLAEHMGYIAHKDAITVLIYTGFRCSELWRLERRDIDLTNNTITAWKTKNGHPRTIPIVEKIKPIIARLIMDNTTTDTDRLFPQASNQWMRSAWDRIRLHMGLDNDPQFVPHMLRHTCATRLAQRGASMVVIKEWMGHSDIQTTSRYTHFAPKDLRNAAELLTQTL